MTVGLLVAWILLGPIAAAFSGCTGMGAMCEGPCGLVSCVVPIAVSSAMPPPTTYFDPQLSDHVLTDLLKVPDPPPKSSPLSA